MIFKNEEKAKELLVEILDTPYVDIRSGLGLTYDNISIIYDGNYKHILENEDYPLILKKIRGIFKLVNENTSLVDADIETDLWYRV